MTELPRHPDADDGDARHTHRRSYGLAIVVVALLLLMVVLHFAGVFGPGSH
jgi:hypothetical protein